MKKTWLFLICLMNVTSYMQAQPKVSIASYYGGRKAAVSYTFDDGIQDQYTLAYPEMKRRGIRATFAIIGSKVDGIIKAKNTDPVPAMTWTQIRQLYADGFEIASHGWNHRGLPRLDEASLKQEVQKNDSAIVDEIGQYPLTFVYPGNSKNDTVVTFVESTRVGSRTKQTRFGGSKDTAYMNAFVDNLLKTGSWGVTMTHGIATGYDHFQDPTQLYSHWDYVSTLQDQLWVAPFCEVAAYVKERDAVKLDVRLCGNCIDVTPTCPLNPTLFTQLLTLEYHGPGQLLSARQGNHELKVYENGRRQFVDFNPHGKTILLTIKK